MKLYFAPNSRAVRIAWLLEELGITYEIEKYSVGDKALRTPEYFKLHPMGRVPVLEDQDITIYESGAIVEYLLAKYDTGHFHPTRMIHCFLTTFSGFIMLKDQLCHKLTYNCRRNYSTTSRKKE